MGDINRLDLSQLLVDCGFVQVNTTPTRGRHVLDVFITNRIDLIDSLLAVNSCLNSDHCALSINCNSQASCMSIRERKYSLMM